MKTITTVFGIHPLESVLGWLGIAFGISGVVAWIGGATIAGQYAMQYAKGESANLSFPAFLVNTLVCVQIAGALVAIGSAAWGYVVRGKRDQPWILGIICLSIGGNRSHPGLMLP